MDENHKITLQKNYKELVKHTNLGELLPKLIENEVFSFEIAEPYMNHNRSELDRKRDLFFDIRRRGPFAFDKLVYCLKEIDDFHHLSLASLLEGKKVVIPQNLNRVNNLVKPQSVIEEEIDEARRGAAPSGVTPFAFPANQRPQHLRQLSQESPHANINITDQPLKVVVRKGETFMDNPRESKVAVYRMRSKCRGIYLGINNIKFINDVKSPRNGANIDEENMKELFKQMGFNIMSHRNQTRHDMKTEIKNFANPDKNPFLKRADCLVVAIMSHGVEGESTESSQIITADGLYLSVSWVLEQFDNHNCSAFQKKPKIFLFQICRGDKLHPGVQMSGRVQSDGFNGTPGHVIRNMSDMLIAFSTLPGDRSYRDIYLGTWYIQCICKIFMEHAYDTDLERLLKMVDEQLSLYMSGDGNMQTSTYESRGFHLCYLNPGLSE